MKFPVLASIRLVVMDVDGTLTDGSMYYSDSGEVCKAFYVRDGMGIVLLKKHGIKTAIMTAERTPVIEKRAARLQIDFVLMGVKEKGRAIGELSQLSGIPLSQIAYIGDDVNDIRAMQLVGFSGCPSDAHQLVRQVSHHVFPEPGGRGAVRHLCDAIFDAQGLSMNPEEPWY